MTETELGSHTTLEGNGRNMVESAAQTCTLRKRSQSEWDEYQDDPEEYLDMIGYDWEEPAISQRVRTATSMK